MAPGVLLDGYYYANDFWYYYQKGGFRCIELATGKLKWEANHGVGSVIAVGRTLIMLLETGRLIFAEATPVALRQIATANLGKNRSGNWFTPPTFVRSRLYVRNYDGDILCIDMAKRS